MYMSYQFGETLIESSKMSSSYLKKEYKVMYEEYINRNYDALIEEENKKNLYTNYLKSISSDAPKYKHTVDKGFKETAVEIFDILRLISINYFNDSTRDNLTQISELTYDKKWDDLFQIIVYLVRPWYKGMINKLEECLYYSIDSNKLVYTMIFIILLIITSVYYWIFWKRYEKNFIKLIKKSFDLINLIPEEIKNIIVVKLNE